MDVILNINNLQYQDIFKNITLSLEKKTMVTIAGGNNTGKTTLCRILDRKIEGNFNINIKGKEIEGISLEKYNHLIQVVYPKEYHFQENTPLEEIERQISSEEKKEIIKQKLERLKIRKKPISLCSTSEKIWIQVLLALLKESEIVILDNLDYYMDSKSLKEVYDFCSAWRKNYQTAFLFTTTSLERAMDTDMLYILQDGEFVLHGEPQTILQRDNILNKAGLEVPFMIDLSVKLRDYDLIKEIELQKERLIETLWN